MKRLVKYNRFIAKQLSRSYSTINDEIQRGTALQVKIANGKRIYMSDYYAETGQIVYENHREACQAKGKILKIGTFIAYATQHILED